MHVVQFLKCWGIEKLKQSYSIRVKECGNSLLILNYTYTSPKYDSITRECRGLILDKDFNIVSRSFDRFFNYGEYPKFWKVESYSVYEKIDGTLIKIYYWDEKWNVSTRNVAFADMNAPNSTFTFKELVLLALGGIIEEVFQRFCDTYMDVDTTYLFELTSEENRNVTKYDGCTLWYLGARKNSTEGEYRRSHLHLENIGIKYPKSFQFKSIEECVEAVQKFENFEEGFVIYDTLTGVPVLKIKNPQYVIMHNNKYKKNDLPTMIKMYLTNESDEYMTYFPETKDEFMLVIKRVNMFLEVCKNMYDHILKTTETDKEFAKKVNLYPWNWIGFLAKKRNQDFITAFHNSCNNDRKIQLLSTEHIILFVGISGSGKSTAALEYEEMGYVNINRDKWRIPGEYIFNRKNENYVTKQCDAMWEEAKSNRKNVIINNCNLKLKYHEIWKNRAKENGYTFLIRYFNISWKQAVKNDLKRNRSVGKDVILKQWKQYQEILNRKRYVRNSEKPRALICDLDGTIAVVNGNRTYYQYVNILKDSPRKEVIAMVQAYSNAIKAKVIFVSGRQDCCRKDTETWLLRYFPEEDRNLILHMRRTGDFREDPIVKEEIFWNCIANDWNVLGVVDDREEVIVLWHDLQIDPIFNVSRSYVNNKNMKYPHQDRSP